MIDRHTRDALAIELRHFAAGLTTNDEFEQRVESLPRTDRAIDAILHAAWYLYDDLRTHRLRDRWALTRRGKREVATWILFLKTDLEYEWPFPSALDALHLLLNLVTLGGWGLLYRTIAPRLYRRVGDLSLWPFRTYSQIANAQLFESVRPRGLR